MELMIAERIKQYRKKRNLTQDALAQVLSVSPQSISKWECGDGYPDITLLPAIANYFEVTVDELIGNDEISAKEDVQKNYFNVVHKLSHDEQLELALQYHKKYPRNWHIATSLMHEITRHHRDKLEEYKPLLNDIVERILKECTDSVSRRNAVKSMCMICDENEVDDWMKRDTRFYHEERLDIWEERYKLMGDDEQYWMYRYAGNFLRVAHALDRLNKHPDYRGNPELCVEWNEMNLRMLNCAVNRANEDEIPDGWIGEYAYVYIRLAAGYFGLGECEKGYAYLEKVYALNERWSQIPDKTPLELGNPLIFGKTMIMKEDYHIVMPNEKYCFNFKGIRYWLHPLAQTMTLPTGWEWFDSVRDEERFRSILEKAKALTNIQ